MDKIWLLLKAYVREFEIANDCKFSNTAWERMHTLHADIWKYISEQEADARKVKPEVSESGE